MKTFDLKNNDSFKKELDEIADLFTQEKINKLQELNALVVAYKRFNAGIKTKSALIKAILKNKITFKNGAFHGNFTLQEMRELKYIGAKWDGRHNCYRLANSQMPVGVMNAIGLVQTQKNNMSSLFSRLFGKKKKDIHIDKTTHNSAVSIVSNMMAQTADYIDNKTNQIDGQKKQVQTNPSQKTVPNDVKEAINKAVEVAGLDFKDRDYDSTKKMRKEFFEALRLNRPKSELEKIISNHIQGTKKRIDFAVRNETRILLQEYQINRMQQAGQTKCKLVHRVPYHPHDRKEHIELFERGNRGEVFELSYIKKVLEDNAYNCHCKIRIVVLK